MSKSVVSFLLVVWLMFSVARQLFPKFRPFRSIFRLDVFQLLPNWKLFSAHTEISRADVELRMRQREDNGAWSDWQVLLPVGNRCLRHSFFNPELRIRKWLLGMTWDIQKRLLQTGNGNVEKSAAFAALNLFCRSRLAGAMGYGQFSITAVDAFGQAPRTLYTSPPFKRRNSIE